MKIVLDTNVLLAAYVTKGICAEILDWCMLNRRLVISSFILNEFETKLVEKFHVPAVQAKRLTLELKKENIFVIPVDIHVPHLRDRSDVSIVATAVTAQAHIVVTGDKDLLDLRAYKNIEFVSPRHFVQRYF